MTDQTNFQELSLAIQELNLAQTSTLLCTLANGTSVYSAPTAWWVAWPNATALDIAEFQEPVREPVTNDQVVPPIRLFEDLEQALEFAQNLS